VQAKEQKRQRIPLGPVEYRQEIVAAESVVAVASPDTINLPGTYSRPTGALIPIRKYRNPAPLACFLSASMSAPFMRRSVSRPAPAARRMYSSDVPALHGPAFGRYGLCCAPMRNVLATLIALLALAGCAEHTSRLDADQEQRLAAQGITRRANDLVFRHTRGAGARWDDRRASIVVTKSTILVHRNGAVEFLLESRSRRACEVHRDHERVRIRAGSGQSAESWSFAPPDDPEGWTEAIRGAIRATRSTSNPSR
jgi:hypothetical protein